MVEVTELDDWKEMIENDLFKVNSKSTSMDPLQLIVVIALAGMCLCKDDLI